MDEPRTETTPAVGLCPKRPQKEAGVRMDPPVSDPKLNGTPATACKAASPPLEPPGVLLVS